MMDDWAVAEDYGYGARFELPGQLDAETRNSVVKMLYRACLEAMARDAAKDYEFSFRRKGDEYAFFAKRLA